MLPRSFVRCHVYSVLLLLVVCFSIYQIFSTSNAILQPKEVKNVTSYGKPHNNRSLVETSTKILPNTTKQIARNEAKPISAKVVTKAPFHGKPYRNSSLVELLRPINIEIWPNHTICDDIDFLVVVITRPNSTRRQAFRDLYGMDKLKQKFRYALLFPLGLHANANVTEEIVEEAAAHGDILQGRFMEHYYNLTLKSMLVLRFVTSNCQNPSAIVKVDDDVTFNVGRVAAFVRERVRPGGYYCLVSYNSHVIRNKKSQYYISMEEYAFEGYPQFCLGSSMIYTPLAATKISAATEGEPFFRLEDVLVTGFLAPEAGVPLTQFPPKTVCAWCSKRSKSIERVNGTIPYTFSWSNVAEHRQLFYDYNKEYL